MPRNSSPRKGKKSDEEIIKEVLADEVHIPDEDLPALIPAATNIYHRNLIIMGLCILAVVLYSLAAFTPWQIPVEEMRRSEELYGVRLVGLLGRLYDVTGLAEFSEGGSRASWVGNDVTYAVAHGCFDAGCLARVLPNTDVADDAHWKRVRTVRRRIEERLWVWGYLIYDPGHLHSFTLREQWEYMFDWPVAFGKAVFEDECDEVCPSPGASPNEDMIVFGVERGGQ
jgi:hypothetical protein